MTSQSEFLARLTRLLNEAGILYMLGVSMCSSIYGLPRATHDADVVIDPTDDQFESLLTLLEEDYYVSRDAALNALQHRTMFNIIDLEAGWKADLIIRKDRPFSHQEFERRLEIDAMGQRLWVVSPEDIILNKLEWMKGRESNVQYSDALGVAITQWKSLDLVYLRKWAGPLGIEDILAGLLREAGEQTERIG